MHFFTLFLPFLASNSPPKTLTKNKTFSKSKNIFWSSAFQLQPTLWLGTTTRKLHSVVPLFHAPCTRWFSQRNFFIEVRISANDFNLFHVITSLTWWIIDEKTTIAKPVTCGFKIYHLTLFRWRFRCLSSDAKWLSLVVEQRMWSTLTSASSVMWQRQHDKSRCVNYKMYAFVYHEYLQLMSPVRVRCDVIWKNSIKIICLRASAETIDFKNLWLSDRTTNLEPICVFPFDRHPMSSYWVHLT